MKTKPRLCSITPTTSAGLRPKPSRSARQFCLVVLPFLFSAVMTFGAADVPAPPAGTPQVSPGGTPQVFITWSAANGATGYKVKRWAAPSGSSGAQELSPDPGLTPREFTDLGGTGNGSPSLLLFNTVYYYAVAAKPPNNSPTYSARTGVRTVPNVPTSLAQVVENPTPSQYQIKLSWSAPVGGSIPAITFTYRVYRSTVNNDPSPPFLNTASTTTYTDTTVTPGVQYYYKVATVGSAEGPKSAQAAAVAPPAAPTGLNVAAGTGAPVISWTAPAGVAATSYRVYRSVRTDLPTFTLLETITAPTTTFKDKYAPVGSVVQYYVKAVNNGGEGPASGKVQGMATYHRLPKVFITKILANAPDIMGMPGVDNPGSYVELLATEFIDFSKTHYSVVFSSNGEADIDGWVGGCSRTYGFNITSGFALAGNGFYVGGTAMPSFGNILRQIDTHNDPGDRFGAPESDGHDVLGNGGGSIDGVAVFATDIWNVKSSTTPVDAIFYGDGTTGMNMPGDAVYDFEGPNEAMGGYETPINDQYFGRKLNRASAWVHLDPGENDTLVVTSGTFNKSLDTFTAFRTWDKNDPRSFTITTTAGAPVFEGIPTQMSGVVGDSTNPELIFTVTPVPNAIPTATSDNPNFVPTVTQPGAAGTYKLTVTPNFIGGAMITVNADAGTPAKAGAVRMRYFATAMGNPGGKFYTMSSDASAAIPLDANYMLVADDEDQVLRVYDRTHSGAPVRVFDMTLFLNLSDRALCSGNLKEMDIEAATSIPITGGKRIFWLGTLGNQDEDGGAAAPNRNRIFATDLTGSDVNSYTLNYMGHYETLKEDLVAWDALANRTRCDGTPLPAGYYGFAAGTATPYPPKVIDGFTVEGLAMVGSVGYIAFRTPYTKPAATSIGRHNALIVPLNNIEAVVTAGATPDFGDPIELDLHGRGIRSIEGNANGFVIVAGPYDNSAENFRLFTWTGNCTDQPEERSVDLSGLNPEAIVEVPSAPFTENSQVMLLSDNGRTQWLGGGIDAKRLPDEFTKFRGDVVTIGPKVNGTWTQVASMNYTRWAHSAISLADGRVLVVGGYGPSGLEASSEIYDPVLDTWTFTAGGMHVGRADAPLVLLPDNKVLVVGGLNGINALDSVEVFDPNTGLWTLVASMGTPRAYHTASLLPDGRVLVAGGDNARYISDYAWDTTEIYDPTMDSWTPSATMTVPRTGHTATTLADGKILLITGIMHTGGIENNTAEVFDPASPGWVSAGTLTPDRNSHSAKLLPNGQVLVAAGASAYYGILTGCELYASGTWGPTAGSVNVGRFGHGTALLPNGKVMIVAGEDGNTPIASTELYNQLTGGWTLADPLNIGRSGPTATLMMNGKVLVTGGFGYGTGAEAEVYNP